MCKFSKRDISSKTTYDLIKKTKKSNFDFLNKICAKKSQLVIFGDSITELFPVELFSEYTREAGLDVYNRGISGDTSDRLLERFDSNVGIISPQSLVILIGTNDIGLGLPEDFTLSNIKELIRRAKNCVTDKIIIQGIYPVNFSVNCSMVGKRNNEKIKKINSRIKALADEENVIFLDLTDILADEKGKLRRDYTYDGLHPNAHGFSAVAGKIVEVLKK